MNENNIRLLFWKDSGLNKIFFWTCGNITNIFFSLFSLFFSYIWKIRFQKYPNILFAWHTMALRIHMATHAWTPLPKGMPTSLTYFTMALRVHIAHHAWTPLPIGLSLLYCGIEGPYSTSCLDTSAIR